MIILPLPPARLSELVVLEIHFIVFRPELRTCKEDMDLKSHAWPRLTYSRGNVRTGDREDTK